VNSRIYKPPPGARTPRLSYNTRARSGILRMPKATVRVSDPRFQVPSQLKLAGQEEETEGHSPFPWKGEGECSLNPKFETSPKVQNSNDQNKNS
jgi:hypothetical protein